MRIAGHQRIAVHLRIAVHPRRRIDAGRVLHPAATIRVLMPRVERGVWENLLQLFQCHGLLSFCFLSSPIVTGVQYRSSSTRFSHNSMIEM